MTALAVGSKVKLDKHPLTKSQGMKGTGVVTALRVTDPVNAKYLVIIRTKGCYLHLNTKGKP